MLWLHFKCCTKNIQKYSTCDICHNYSHFKCAGINSEKRRQRVIDGEISFHCKKCINEMPALSRIMRKMIEDKTEEVLIGNSSLNLLNKQRHPLFKVGSREKDFLLVLHVYFEWSRQKTTS